MKYRIIAILTVFCMTGVMILPGCGDQRKAVVPAKETPPQSSESPSVTKQPKADETQTETPNQAQGAYKTGIYRNVFKEAGYSDQEISDKLNQAWNDLFYGDENTRIFYPSGDEAYILDVGNGDVRSEGMSYGMMMCVQMDKKQEFDQLWKWAKTNMQVKSGPNEGYFSWSLNPDGTRRDEGPAPDGEEYFAMALFFASHRWGDGEAPFDYSNQARYILRQALHKPDNKNEGYALWDKEKKLIRFVPTSTFTDPSYHLPHFYELFSFWADPEDREFWKEAAKASREYLKLACHPETGLAPDYATFDGQPVSGGGDHDRFAFDAFRVAGNIGLDYAWFAADPWEKEQADKIQAFFVKQGLGRHYGNYTIDGKPVSGTFYQPAGLVAMNAMASLATEGPNVKLMVDDLWKKSPGKGQWRYYDDCLYFFSLLALSGNYRIW